MALNQPDRPDGRHALRPRLLAGGGGRGQLPLGDAEFFGSAGALRLNRPVVGMAPA
jgi:hypothetical protein